MRLLVANWQDRLNPQAGGAEIHLHETFGRLAQRGHEVTLLVSGWDDAPRRAELDGMAVHRVGGRYTFNVAAPAYYRRTLRNRNFDLFVEDLNKVPLFAPYWAREPMALIVHHLFGMTAFQEASPPVAAATWLLEGPLAFAYRDVPTVAVSESTSHDLQQRGFPRAAIQVIPNGVDLDFYTPAAAVSKSATPLILYLGRLKRYKRIDLIIRAFTEVVPQHATARLLIAGQGDARPELEALVAELGLNANVEFTGFVAEEQKRDLLRRAWIHALTSSKEGWGITNIEAAACGTPTVASDAPGLRDSVRPGTTGFLVPHGDVPALAMRMNEIVSSVDLRARLSAGAIAFAQTFAWDDTAARMESFLEAAAAKHRS